jgi:enolase
VTNTKRLQMGIEKGVANSILVKVNQIGTLTETIEAVNWLTGTHTLRDEPPFGRNRRYHHCRPGCSADTGLIKTGSASRTDRICKYNQLMRIEEILGSSANTWVKISNTPVEVTLLYQHR